MSSLFIFCFFKQKSAYEMRISDWSSDVCSSDLQIPHLGACGAEGRPRQLTQRAALAKVRSGDRCPINSSLRVYTSSDSIPDHTLRVRNMSWRVMGKKNDHLSRDNKTSVGNFYTICPIMDQNPCTSASN